MTQVKVAKSGVNAATATDPNDFIFHSDYNTFKIVATGLFEPTITANTSNVDYKVEHTQDHVPLILAYMKEGTIAEVLTAQNFSPNVLSYLEFNSISADYQYLIFNITNTHATNDIVAHIRYFILEVPL